MNLKRRLVVLIVSMMLSACADFSALRNCDKSGEAHYAAIPLASRSEHEQSRRFMPLDTGNCLVYVVREKDWWSGTSVSRATVMLAPADPERTMLPSELYAHCGDQVLEIDRNVYAMWELPPNAYLVTAIFNRSFGVARDYNLALKTLEQEPFSGVIAQVELYCRPGGLLFIGVGDRGYSNHIVIKELSEEDGRTYVPNGIRSVGFTDHNDRPKVWYKDCPGDK